MFRYGFQLFFSKKILKKAFNSFLLKKAFNYYGVCGARGAPRTADRPASAWGSPQNDS
jgi:hypothetical protein